MIPPSRFVIQAVAHLGLALTKLLYILLYARVFSGPEQRAIFSFTGGLILVWAVVVLFLMIFRCNPVRDVRPGSSVIPQDLP